MTSNISKKITIKIVTLLLIVMTIPAIGGMYNLVTNEISNGKCLTEYEDQEFHRTKGVAKYKSIVVSDGHDSFVIKNMTCDGFKNPVNPFRFKHPYWSLYSIFVIMLDVAVVVGMISATICAALDSLFSRKKHDKLCSAEQK